MIDYLDDRLQAQFRGPSDDIGSLRGTTYLQSDTFYFTDRRAYRPGKLLKFKAWFAQIGDEAVHFTIRALPDNRTSISLKYRNIFGIIPSPRLERENLQTIRKDLKQWMSELKETQGAPTTESTATWGQPHRVALRPTRIGLFEVLRSTEKLPMSDDKRDSNPSYVLGHSDHELNRLRAQARLLEPVTRQFLHEAGITQGMRVLDVGSGAGEVAFLAAELVGEAGFVLGTDKAPVAIATATQAAGERGLRNVQFREGNPAEMAFDGRFDAVVGRYVLPFQTDPSAMLRGLARHLAPGGLVVFHEPDWTCVRSFPPAPLYDRACRWIADTTRLSGQSWNFLDRAHTVFVGADLPPPTMRMHTFVAGDANAREWLMAVGDIVESLLPAMVRLSVATAAEVDLETFRDRLLQEVLSNRSVIVGRSEIGIWTTVRRDAA